MKRYSVETAVEAATRYFYIQDCETMEMELLPSKYLMHKVKSNRSPNTEKRSAFALCYYLEYLSEKQMEIPEVCLLAYDEQNEHFVRFLYWLKTGRHKKENDISKQWNLQRIFKRCVQVLSFYGGGRSRIREPPGPVLRADHRSECSWCKTCTEGKSIWRVPESGREECPGGRAGRDRVDPESLHQLLILLIAETGFRIGEILGVSYTRDIDYGNHTIRVWFRDDNENDARVKNAEYRRSRISDDTFEFLLHYLAEYRKLLQRQDYLFVNISGETAGQPLKVGSVYDMLGRMEKKTQIRITPHMLRPTS